MSVPVGDSATTPRFVLAHCLPSGSVMANRVTADAAVAGRRLHHTALVSATSSAALPTRTALLLKDRGIGVVGAAPASGAGNDGSVMTNRAMEMFAIRR